MPLDILRQITWPEGVMVQLFFCWSDGHASCTGLLHLDATSVIPPHAAPFLLGTSTRVLRPKPVNRPSMVLRPKPSNHPWVAYSICVPYNSLCATSVLDRPAAKSSRASARLVRPPSWLGQHGHCNTLVLRKHLGTTNHAHYASSSIIIICA
jgi:hypothetical protein